MSILTRSEIFFERFCGETRIRFTPIPPESEAGRRTPDYEFHLQEPPILVEVKQIDLNPDDKALLRQLQEIGMYEFQDVLGKRLRGKISEASSQLKARVMTDQPALLIVYNNVDVIRGFTTPRQMMSAMYGQHEVVLTRSHGKKKGDVRAECAQGLLIRTKSLMCCRKCFMVIRI